MIPEPRPEDPLDAAHAPATGAASPSQGLFAWYAPGFSDGLGDRLLLFDNTDGRPLELLRLRADLATAGGFEFALRERAHELAGFDDEHFARVCRVDKLPDPGGGLAIVSEHIDGVRLSDLLAVAHSGRVRLTPQVGLALMADLVAGLAALHARGSHLAHGAVGPERLVLTPGGRVLITEYVLGLALRRVPLDRRGWWRELRVALPSGADVEPFGQRTDLLQAGLTALALLLARPLAPDHDPSQVPALLDEAEERAQLAGCDQASWRRLRGWLVRLLSAGDWVQFADAVEARRALDEVLNPERAAGDLVEHLARFVQDARHAEAPHTGLELEHGLQLTAPPEPPEAPPEPVAPPSDHAALPAPPPRRWGQALRALAGRRLPVAILVLFVLLEGAYIAAHLFGNGSRAAPVGTVRIESNPTHASVFVDGKPAGTTPAALRLVPGRHDLELALGARRRRLVVPVEAGASVAQYVELPAEVGGGGRIDVRSDPAGARVLVDGQPRGVTPLVVAGLPAGEHQVRIESRGRAVAQSVVVAEAQASTVFVPFPGGLAPMPGWLAIASPVELQVYEDNQLLGTTRAERIMLAAGRHEVSLVNDVLGVRTSREVQVPVGRTATLDVKLPDAHLDINAAPWAEVSVDGQKVGETPLSGVAVAPGRHLVKFRHPTLGERTIECVATLLQPTRVSTDLRK